MAGPADAVRGFGLLLQGGGLVLRRGRLFGLGLIPPLITSLGFVTLFVALVWQAPSLAVWLTPFAEGWPAAEPFRALAALGIAVASGLLLVLLFSTTTLALGAPLYDRISEAVDVPAALLEAQGHRPGTSAADALRRVVGVAMVTIPLGLALLVIGLVPVVGNVFATVGSGLVGGWIVALDMMGPALDRRGTSSLRQRHELLRRNPWLALGFGLPTFLLVSLPLVQVIAFPIATAGATLLARRLTAEPGGPRA